MVGAMRQVMHEGRLGAQVRLDSLTAVPHAYGLGPLAGLRGELLLYDGTCYVATVGADSSLTVRRDCTAGAPFFVHTQVPAWKAVTLPAAVSDLAALEEYLTERASGAAPFAFRLEGTVRSAVIHSQNLAPGSRVRSPAEAHAGQVDYSLPAGTPVRILGFYSTRHQGIFTHHDSYVHLHLITADERQMGHVDALEPGALQLYLPATED